MSQQVLYTTDIHYKILKSHDIEFLDIFIVFFSFTFCGFSIISIQSVLLHVQGCIHLSMIKSILINKYGRLFFPHS